MSPSEAIEEAREALRAAEENAKMAKDYGQKGKAGDAGFHATHVLYALARASRALAALTEDMVERMWTYYEGFARAALAALNEGAVRPPTDEELRLSLSSWGMSDEEIAMLPREAKPVPTPSLSGVTEEERAELAAVRARHEAVKGRLADDAYYSSPNGYPVSTRLQGHAFDMAHADRAFLLSLLPKEPTP